eukprot:m.34582 g.34582  ORF g.34582 m.34582 type:complete len:303 (+) comp17000_c0_seq1:125-1033(+)
MRGAVYNYFTHTQMFNRWVQRGVAQTQVKALKCRVAKATCAPMAMRYLHGTTVLTPPAPVIVFDKDGVLLDTNKTWLPIMIAKANYLVIRSGGRTDRNTFLAAVGIEMYGETDGIIHEHGMFARETFPDMRKLWAEIEPSLVPVFEDAQVYDDEIRQIYQATAGNTVAKGNVIHTLTQLKVMGHTLAVVTNDTMDMTKSHLKDMGIDGFFDVVMCADSGFGEKPQPGGLLQVCSELGISPNDAMMVGDTRADYEAFVSAGFADFVCVADCAPHLPPFIPTAKSVIPSIEHLPQLLVAKRTSQ